MPRNLWKQASNHNRAAHRRPTGTAPNTNPGAQQPTTPPAVAATPLSTLDDTVDAGEMDDDIDHAPREMAKWNEYRGPHFIAKAGIGFLVDTAANAQDTESKEQITMHAAQRTSRLSIHFGG